MRVRSTQPETVPGTLHDAVRADEPRQNAKPQLGPKATRHARRAKNSEPRLRPKPAKNPWPNQSQVREASSQPQARPQFDINPQPGANAQPQADSGPAATTTSRGAQAADGVRNDRRAPGLDGVRALAVLAVLGFHEGLPWLRGGFLGVDVFFVLSGFLITDILATKFAAVGNVGLRTFWQRRARRLLPALGIMLLAVTAAVTVLEPDQRSTLPPALVGAVTYTSNWWQALARQSYFSLYGPPPVFQHLWSLAVEEQFYLIWPLVLTVVLFVLRSRVLRVLFVWAAALASAYVMYVIYVPGKDPSLVYYGTDTHATGLLIGAALALTWPLARVIAAAGKLRFSFEVLGLAGLAVLGWAVWHLSGADPFVYPFGLSIAALAAGGLVLAAAAPGLIGAMLSWPPLRWLGVRSYGIYLWHWPVIALTAGLDERGANTQGARLIDAIVPIGIAAASWRWLEEPILRRGLRAELKRRGQILRSAPKGLFGSPAVTVPAIIGAIGLLAVTSTAGYGLLNQRAGQNLQSQINHAALITVETQQQSQVLTEPVARAEPWRLGAATARDGLSAHRRSPVIHDVGAKVMAIGDSVMLASAPELIEAMPGIYVNAKVSRAMIAGVAIVQDLAAQGRLRRVLVVGLGTNGPITLWQIQQLRRAIGPHRWLLLVNTFVPRPWEAEVNATVLAAVRKYPNVRFVNWHKAIEHRTDLLWSDGIHPMPVGGKLYARVVRAAVLEVVRLRPVFRPRLAHDRIQGGSSRFWMRRDYAWPS